MKQYLTYGPWPEELCSLCFELLWDQKSLVMTRGCCKNRFHTLCYYNDICDNEEVPKCGNWSCKYRHFYYQNHFLFFDHTREVRGVYCGKIKDVYGLYQYDWKVLAENVNQWRKKLRKMTPKNQPFANNNGYEYLHGLIGEDVPPEALPKESQKGLKYVAGGE